MSAPPPFTAPPPTTTAPPPPSTTVPPPPPATSPQTPTISPPVPEVGNVSPPAPSRRHTPPTTHSSGVTPSDSPGLSTGLVIGIAVVGLFLFVFFTILCVCCCNKNNNKRKRKQQQPGYNYKPPPYKGNAYGAPAYNWQEDNVTPPVDHMVNIPPNPSLQPPRVPMPPNVPPSPPPPPRVPMPPSVRPTPPPPPPAYVGSSEGFSDASYVPLPPPSPGVALGFDQSSFTYEELALATDGFSDANLLGQGGFGYVHRGVLSSGKEVAIKQLKAGSRQGEREFQTEVDVISRVHHKHLVSLVGYCMTGSRMMLVYEFVPNNNLEFHLHGRGRPLMDWRTRLKIALGSAKGLAYLHEDCNPKIIHRDIKGSNILLDFNFEAKVADFGLAKLTSDANTHVSTRVMGTFGYLAPEYAASGKLTEKSDVFSFGVVLLELITGRRPVDSDQSSMDDSLVDWARPLLSRALEDGNFNPFVDRRIQYNHSEMARMVACASACVRHAARWRPRMSQVVRALEGDVSLLSDYNEIITPGQSTVYSSHGSSDYDSVNYNEDMRKFRKMAAETKEYGSSDVYSNPTSEYSLHPSGSSNGGQETREMEMGKMKRQHSNG